jgi:hypothetical protein|tara:strand:- start:177 stop:314 length:138 start_codon:yes stop_codon:yes gene_type:complete
VGESHLLDFFQKEPGGALHGSWMLVEGHRFHFALAEARDKKNPVV